jgi:conserved oligomeric Golgi complex subunit 3
MIPSKLSAQRNFRDAEIYLIRFQQCLTRSLTLIKMYFIRTVTALGQEVSEKTLGKVRCSFIDMSILRLNGFAQELQEAAQNTLLYTKFETFGETVQSLIYELEKRARSEPDEYNSLMNECFQAWFTVRNQLLAQPLAEEVKRMDPQNSDLIKLVSLKLLSTSVGSS